MNLKYLMITVIVIGFAACKKIDLNTPVEKASTKPGVVSNVKVKENTNGASSITYTLPASQDLLYVKAVYDIRPGVKREVVASYYTNTMVLDGFGDAGPHDVQLYAVSRSEQVSDPVSVTVNPLESPVRMAFENLKVQADFGGPNIKTINSSKSPIVIVPLIDSLNTGYTALDKVYTQIDSINVSIRGLADKPTKFAFYVTDRFGNTSDTLYKEMTPFAEVKMDKSKFSEYTLPGDASMAYTSDGVKMSLMWNDNYSLNAAWPKLYTVTTDLSPQTITWSIGVTKTLSRMVIFPRSENYDRYYEQGNLKTFEVWGSPNPNTDGSYDGTWIKLATKTIIRPSGLSPGSASTAEDIAYAKGGWEVVFESGLPAVKYLRIRSLENWQGTTWMMISQIDLYGSK